MIQLVPQMKILLAREPADFRRGIDALSALCRQQLDADPFSGTLFVFRNRSGSSLKILVYDSTGFWLLTKRFSKGKISWWPTATEPASPLAAAQLQVLLYGGNPESARFAEPWRKIA